MAGKSDFLENEILDHNLGVGAYAAPVPFVGLFTAPPTDAGGGTEVTGGSYARVAITGDFSAAVAGSSANTSEITFAQATASWGTVTDFGIFDAITAGNLLYWNALTTSKSVAINDTAKFAIGALVVTED